MVIKNFSDFLLEKESVKEREGTGPWFLEYVSGITKEKVRLTKEDIIKISENFDKIDTLREAEKMFEFAKYCILGPENDKREKSDIKSIKDTPLKKPKEGEKGGETIGKILSKNINKVTENEIRSIYIRIQEILSTVEKTITYKDLVEKLSKFVIPKNGGSDDEIWVSQKEVKKNKTDYEFKNYSIPLNPTMIKLILTQSEICVRYSLACIKQINTLVSNNEKGVKDAVNKKISDIEGEKGLKSIAEKNKSFLGEGKAKEGIAWDFWKSYTEAKDDSEKIKIIKEGKGIKGKDIESYISLFEFCQKEIRETVPMVDTGKITKDEWYENVVSYYQGEKGGGSEEEKKNRIEIGEGLKAAMYSMVKEAIQYLQDGINNYSLVEGDKNALKQLNKRLTILKKN